MSDPGGAGDGFEANLDALDAVASKADSLGNEIVGLARLTADESASAVENLPGWALAGAIRQAQAVCEHNTAGFGRWTADVGDRLSATVAEYRRTDEWNMQLLGGQGV